MQPGVPGGYYSADITDPRVNAAAKFAFRALPASPFPRALVWKPSTSYQVLEASQQVVAGMNYRLKIQINDNQQQQQDQQTCLGTFTVIVYDHFGELSITEWGEANMPCPSVVMSDRSEAVPPEQDLAT